MRLLILDCFMTFHAWGCSNSIFLPFSYIPSPFSVLGMRLSLFHETPPYLGVCCLLKNKLLCLPYLARGLMEGSISV